MLSWCVNPRCHSGMCAKHTDPESRDYQVVIPGSRWRAPRNDEGPLTLLLRLELLARTAGIAPGGEAATHMRDRLQPHILRGFRRQRRTHAAGAMEDEFLFLLKHRLGIGARRIDPEFQHAAGAGERAGNPPVALDLARIADIDDHDVVALRRLDGIGRAHRFDLCIGLVDQGFDAAVNGLGHYSSLPIYFCLPIFRHSGAIQASNPESRSIFIPSRFRIRLLRGLSGMTVGLTAPVPSSRLQDPRS